jgi:RimJ/RimL family protein N-acetyltransferase
MYIVETFEGVAVGQVRFDREGRFWEIHYALAPVFRRRGLGRALLVAALGELGARFPAVLVRGQVKSSNLASRKVFESLGFDQRSTAEGAILVYERTL